MKVFLTGATGFVGSHMLRRLLRDGHEVRALVRRRSALAEVAVKSGALEAAEGDVGSLNLAALMADSEAMINLVGIICERDQATFEAVHHQGTKNLVQAASQSGVKRLVQMSALGARAGDASPYHTTKFAAEEEVRNSGIAWVVLRPSLVSGPGSAFVQQMIEVMRASPLIRPIPGTGKYLFRPVHVDDVVECFVQSLSNAAALGQTVDLVGGEELTLNDIGDAIARCLEIRKTAVHIPMSLMKMAAAVLSLLPIKPPVTSIQLRMLEEGSTADPAQMKRVFGIEPVAFREGLRRYLCPDSA